MATINKSMMIADFFRAIPTASGDIATFGENATAFLVAGIGLSSPTNGDTMEVIVAVPLSFATPIRYKWTYTGGAWTCSWMAGTFAAAPPTPMFIVPPNTQLTVLMFVASGSKSMDIAGTAFTNFQN